MGENWLFSAFELSETGDPLTVIVEIASERELPTYLLILPNYFLYHQLLSQKDTTLNFLNLDPDF